MSDSHAGHGATAHPSDHPFSEEEWGRLQATDRAAGRAVVILMLSIFLVGVVLYTIVALTVASG